MSENDIRLQKYIAMSGVASRRRAEELIKAGLVEVNGEVVTEFGVKVDPETDSVVVNGEPIKPEKKKHYIMLNKPAGYITTLDDEFGRKTVLELTKDIKERIFPVGRLDYETEGLLFMTNDGDFANSVAHPRSKLKKTYVTKIKGVPTPAQVKTLQNGVDIGDYVTLPAEVKVKDIKDDACEVVITIHEGKNRQIRRMFEVLELEVVKLKRISIGSIQLGHVQVGRWRKLVKGEVDALLRGAGMRV